MVKKRKVSYFKFSMLTALAVFFVITAILILSPIGSVSAMNGKCVVIDPGHGGVDGGSVGSFLKLKESEINLAIALKLKKKLEAEGFKTVMTRSDDNGLYGDSSKGFKRRDMNKRCEIINNSGADIAVSIHLNRCEVEYRYGGIVFFKRNNDNSKNLAGDIQQEINKLYAAPRDKSLPRSDFFLFKHSQVPIALVECGFISNQKEEQNLSRGEYQDKVASAVATGVKNYFFADKTIEQ